MLIPLHGRGRTVDKGAAGNTSASGTVDVAVGDTLSPPCEAAAPPAEAAAPPPDLLPPPPDACAGPTPSFPLDVGSGVFPLIACVLPSTASTQCTSFETFTLRNWGKRVGQQLLTIVGGKVVGYVHTLVVRCFWKKMT